MRTALVLVAIASTALADERPKLAVVHALPGIDLVETINQARHEHGGKPAVITSAHLNFAVRDGKAHAIVAKHLELLDGYCNDDWKLAKHTPLAITGYEVHDWDSADPIAHDKAKAVLPAKRELYQVSVAFDGESVYQACNRFAFAMALTIDGGKPTDIEIPLDVIRFEPLRKRP